MSEFAITRRRPYYRPRYCELKLGLRYAVDLTRAYSPAGFRNLQCSSEAARAFLFGFR